MSAIKFNYCTHIIKYEEETSFSILRNIFFQRSVRQLKSKYGLDRSYHTPS